MSGAGETRSVKCVNHMPRVTEIVERFMQPVEGESVSPRLRGLLEDFYLRATERPSRLEDLKASLIELLTFLTTIEGKTNANCCAVDSFVMLDDHWECRWTELPTEYVDVIALMGEALHDTIAAPEVARNCGCTPEQILVQAKFLPA